MKKMFLSLATFVATSAFAGTNSQVLNTTVKGTIEFRGGATVTCMAIGCPPSKPYFKAILKNANVSGYGIFSEVELSPVKTAYNVFEKPSHIVYKGTRLKEGMKYEVTGQIILDTYLHLGISRVYVNEIKSIKLVR